MVFWSSFKESSANARMQHVTRELKLALIVGFSLVLVVMVLVSDHLSKATKAELAPAANEIALAAKLNVLQPQDLNPRNPNMVSDPLEPITTINQGGPRSIEDQQVSLEQAAKRLGLATKEGNPNALIGIEPLLLDTGSMVPPMPMSNAMTGGVTPLGESDAPAHLMLNTSLSPTKYNNGQGPVLGKIPTALDDLQKEVSAATSSDTGNAASHVTLHVIESGESLYGISKQYYGNGKYWKQLLEYNKTMVKSETGLKTGMKIKVPQLTLLTGKPADAVMTKVDSSKTVNAALAATTETKPDAGKSAKGKTYIVQKGDTPGAIAKRALGTSKRARELMELNKIDDDGGLKIGMVLKLPD